MKTVNFFNQLYRRDAWLTITGWVHIGLLLVFLLLMPFDNRQVMNIDPWIKPAKFATSIAVFAWSMGWFMYELKTPRTKIYSRLFTLFLSIEMFIITLQAARGTTSHFNVFQSAFDAGLFATMGIFISLNLLLTIIVLLEFFRPSINLPAYMVWAIRLGLFSLVLASIEGFVMVKFMAHTVGAADGGPGLPVLNWSTVAGDLRIAHFLGMHGLQLFPFVAYLLSRLKHESIYRFRTSIIMAFAGCYLVLMNYTFWQALQKIPLISLG